MTITGGKKNKETEFQYYDVKCYEAVNYHDDVRMLNQPTQLSIKQMTMQSKEKTEVK